VNASWAGRAYNGNFRHDGAPTRSRRSKTFVTLQRPTANGAMRRRNKSFSSFGYPYGGPFLGIGVRIAVNCKDAVSAD
jgi:hypothetical protein